MIEKSNDSTPNRPEGARLLDAPLVPIDLTQYTQQIRSEQAWEKTDRNAITVFKSQGMNIVLIALHKGAEMKRHSAPGIISLQVLEGLILFKTDDESREMGKGQMLALHEKIPHSVMALEESVFLLTHAKIASH
jgi:quercetin dioxygenase-like cupin family protein